ncbi:MAG: FxLYD domain-containing protein [Chloroflexota bacterium]|nr:FxLYD domain-containing protein [Chloroflexota bacterium]
MPTERYRREAKWLLTGIFVFLLGCGQVITLPTPTPPPATADVHLNTVVPRATSTPAPATPTSTLSPTLTPTPIIYVVKRGDTLSGIAKQFGIPVEALMDANEVYDPRRLQIGQKLLIPREEEKEQAPPTPTPTPLPMAVENLNFHETPVGSLWCLGEVRNLAGMDVEYVQVQVSLYDADNTVLDTATAFTVLDIIPAGETSPFAVLFAQPPTAYATYQVLPLSAEPSTYLGSRYRDLDVVEHEGQAQGRLFTVSGRVRNIGDEQAIGVEVVITAYDSHDRVVAMREVEVQGNVLAPGDSAPFTASISPMGNEVARYTVQVQGHQIA